MGAYDKELERWLTRATADPDLIEELESIKNDEKAVEDRFFKSLEFGTGGLRGVLGAGTNRMNVYTVGQATQGLADVLNAVKPDNAVAIGYDSRIKSDRFAAHAAGVLAANGVRVYLYRELMPTPMISFAVRRLRCDSGIVITASHNPSKYNGYKCYDRRGYQMTDADALATYNAISKVDLFDGVKCMALDEALEKGLVSYIGDDLIEAFYEEILALQPDPGIFDEVDLKLIYSPLNGTGNKPVREVLRRIGVKDLRVVESQERPDGTFPTCPFPNPEIRQVFEEGLKMTADFPADLIIATDPDCDRVGIAVRHDGAYQLMTGNEVGCMLTQYLLERRQAKGTLPEKPVIVKSIVTSELIRMIADDFGGETANVLTGFKYIGELVEKLDNAGEADRFILGLEESYGYLSGTHAREKDAVNASMLIAEMAAYYKKQGRDLTQVMAELYEKYGLYLNTLLNFVFEGADGMRKMQGMMDDLRANAPRTVGPLAVLSVSDYLTRETADLKTGAKTPIDLPKSNVLSYALEGGSGVVVRPSGTEPKIKVYLTAVAPDAEAAQRLTDALGADMKAKMGIEE